MRAVNKLSIYNPTGGKFDQHDIRAHTGIPHMPNFYNDIIGSIRVPPLPSAHLPRDISH
jgi:hypothetical protein